MTAQPLSAPLKGQHFVSMLNKLIALKRKKEQPLNEEFIIKYNESFKNEWDHLNDDNSKRLVFVSLNGLYHSYYKCPPHLLYSSIFILPLKREWIWNQNKNDSVLLSMYIYSLYILLYSLFCQ